MRIQRNVQIYNGRDEFRACLTVPYSVWYVAADLARRMGGSDLLGSIEQFVGPKTVRLFADVLTQYFESLPDEAKEGAAAMITKSKNNQGFYFKRAY